VWTSCWRKLIPLARQSVWKALAVRDHFARCNSENIELVVVEELICSHEDAVKLQAVKQNGPVFCFLCATAYSAHVVCVCVPASTSVIFVDDKLPQIFVDSFRARSRRLNIRKETISHIFTIYENQTHPTHRLWGAENAEVEKCKGENKRQWLTNKNARFWFWKKMQGLKFRSQQRHVPRTQLHQPTQHAHLAVLI